MTGPEVDSSFRMRYDIVHRDHAGTLIMKPFSEWDEFHSSKIWGVFGIVDCTQPGVCDSPERRKQTIFDAYDDFNAALGNFKDASVRRLVVFTSQDAAHESGPFVLNDPESPSKDSKPTTPLHFSVGYVPERSKYEETRLEVKAQIIHFAGLLLNALDRDCWKRKESPATDLFLSPIDEKYSADRQSKLAKRRAGRLDKLLGDSLLLMGSPSEALMKYNSAIEKAKANSDRLWLAGAMEGWSAAHVLNHVGSRGSVSDPILSDRLIEYYAEIYKLYQKKRVAEPEAAAALRLAEFLGRWTNRRKDALDAAEHAATVGEGLRVQKRAALWEALARFSDRMGCRRKAALYLYRLGHLNASQSIWSSAVTLMIASERQLSRNSRKPWADLNRRVLLTAAGHAEDAGDSNTAARLRVEALVIPPHLSKGRREDDENLIKSLNKAQVPAHLPAAQHVIRLGGITALQIPGLSIQSRVDVDIGSDSSGRVKDGPFIYNPFEAKKRAKAAAVARRAVTWVCGEPAQISARLYSKIGAELVVDIIAVLLVAAERLHNGEVDASSQAIAEKCVEGDRPGPDDDNGSGDHRRTVQAALKRSNQIAKTIQESALLPSREFTSGMLKHVTVIPKRTGPLRVHGLLVRLFNGALVLLQSERKQKDDVPPVNVICSLPRISLSSYSAEGGTMQNISSRTPLTVYHGEKRRFRVDVENTGNEAITWMKARVFSSHPEVLEITMHNFKDETVLKNLENHGSSKSFTVEVLGKKQGNSGGDSRVGQDHFLTSVPSLSIVSVIIEYEGTESAGTIRESGAYVRVSSMSALEVGRIDLCDGYPSTKPKVQAKKLSEYSVSLEVRNCVTAPATVKLLPCEADVAERPSCLSSQDCLVESGASVRLMCSLPVDTVNEFRKEVQSEEPMNHSKALAEAVYRIQWELPALGRQGLLNVPGDEVSRAISRSQIARMIQPSTSTSFSCSAYSVARAEVFINIRGHDLQNCAKDEGQPSLNVVNVGRFWSAKVQIRNTSHLELPMQSLLDISLVQTDDHGHIQEVSRAILVGATDGVFVGPLLARTGVFEHSIRVRVPSTGTFQLQAFLYDGSMPGKATSVQLPRAKGAGKQLPVHAPGEELGAARLYLNSSVSSSVAGRAPTDDNPAADLSIKQVATEPTTHDFSTTGPNFRDGWIDSPRSRPLPETPRGLKRVNISRRRKPDDARIPMVIIQPTTVDTYPATSPPQKRPAILGCCSISFTAVQDSPAVLTRRTDYESPKTPPSILAPRGTPDHLTSATNQHPLYH